MTVAALALVLALTAGCGDNGVSDLPAEDDAFLEDVQARTFGFFWETTNPANGLVPDRWPDPPFSSVAAIGFGLTAYPVGVERGWIDRARARDRALTTLRFLWTAPQGPDAVGTAGHRGFFYHFLDMDSGLRFETIELSTIDTALLMAGVLAVGEYFDGDGAVEAEIRALADSLYRRVEWDWTQVRPPAISHGWRPESGFIEWDYLGYNEAMILYLLALGSPTHPIAPEAWERYTSAFRWGEFYDREQVNFPPLFGHQYSHVWIDFRGIRDDYMRSRGIDYSENSRRAAYAQQAYAMDNPDGWEGYGETVWGLTASDGPGETTLVVDGVEREIHGYWARGAALGDIRDDGTIAPTAAGGSVPFAPEIAIPALRGMRRRWGEHLYGRYGFRDAFNPTIQSADAASRGRVVPGAGWFNIDYLGIDQGPIVLMIENHRTGLIWDLMKQNPHIVRGLCRAGFRGGWLDGRCDAADGPTATGPDG